MLLKNMVESSPLSEDEPLTPNTDKVMGIKFLEVGLKIQKSAKIGLLNLFFEFIHSRLKSIFDNQVNQTDWK